jgi:hypothetical protein
VNREQNSENPDARQEDDSTLCMAQIPTSRY